jgi:ABC-type sugar transport system permease subunit
LHVFLSSPFKGASLWRSVIFVDGYRIMLEKMRVMLAVLRFLVVCMFGPLVFSVMYGLMVAMFLETKKSSFFIIFIERKTSYRAYKVLPCGDNKSNASTVP